MKAVLSIQDENPLYRFLEPPGQSMKRVARGLLGLATLRVVPVWSPDPNSKRLAQLAKFAKHDTLKREAEGRPEPMPTRNISLTPEQDAFVEKVVEAGEYQNASEAVRDALRVLRQRRREDALKLKGLRAQLQAGVDALERGEFVQIEDRDLNAYVSRLIPTRSRRRR